MPQHFKNIFPYFSPYLEICPVSPHVREELQTLQHPYFVRLKAQGWSGSLGRVKAVF